MEAKANVAGGTLSHCRLMVHIYVYIYMRDRECTVSQMGSNIQQNITLCPFKWAAEYNII